MVWASVLALRHTRLWRVASPLALSLFLPGARAPCFLVFSARLLAVIGSFSLFRVFLCILRFCASRSSGSPSFFLPVLSSTFFCCALGLLFFPALRLFGFSLPPNLPFCVSDLSLLGRLKPYLSRFASFPAGLPRFRLLPALIHLWFRLCFFLCSGTGVSGAFSPFFSRLAAFCPH